ncbi:hypothetical protein AALO_G00145430 [Alosa alosa]|uniref:DUF1279 domain-containing protein n=1 Tax=Alosa alosa TaxID=278164 RepID=A0AAV6GNT2_9TELE|nr:protein FAM210B, mitochondrial [Alosa alosa]KAG5275262.1 hypothetical protein AALO_G00145430 [Alosa alosa]
MLLCRILKPSAATFSTQSLNSVQVSANRLRLGCINLTCSLRNNTTIPVCSLRVCGGGYAYNTPRISSLQMDGGREEKNTNIFTDSSTVEIGQPSHLERAYISDVAQGTSNNTNGSSRLSYPVCGNGTIFRVTELESFLFSSRAKVSSIWLHTTIVPMRTASSTAAQPKHDTGDEGHTAANAKEKHESSPPPPSQGSQGSRPAPQPEEEGKPSKTQQLKKVFKEYGAVGVSFHVAISLMSLGMFYLAVSSGIDMAAILYKVGFSESVVQSKLAAGTSTFVLAYAVHKLFAPVRISITLMSVPLIVRYFRKTGLFKPPASSP